MTKKIDRAKMMEMYHQGKTYIEIADYFGTKSGGNIEKLIRSIEQGTDKQKVETLWRAGWGIESIMKECNCTEEEIRGVVFRDK